VKDPLHLVRVVSALAVLLAFAFLPGSAVAAPTNGGASWLYPGSPPGSATVLTTSYQDSASSLQDITLQVTGSTPSTYQWTNLAVKVNGATVPNPCVPLTGATGGLDCPFASGTVNNGDSVTLSFDTTPAIPLGSGGTLVFQNWLNQEASFGVSGPALTLHDLRVARTAITNAQAAEHSVHYVLVAPEAGAKIVGDVDGHRGIQRLTISRGGKTGHATKLLVNLTIYLRGDAFALHQLGFSTAFTSRYAGKWVSARRGSLLYDALHRNVTLATWMLYEMPTGQLAAVAGTVNGKAVWGLCDQGPAWGSCVGRTIYVPYDAHPLIPVGGAVIERDGRIADRFTLSRWHEAVRVKAPAHAVPIG
jgi:hypothetical protein